MTEGLSNPDLLVLTEKIREASKSALSQKEADARADAQQKTVEAFLNKRLSLEEFERQMKVFENEPGSFKMRTYIEFKAALTMLCSVFPEPARKPMIDWYLKHENEHMAKAKEQGASASYAIQIIRGDAGALNFVPAVLVTTSARDEPESVRRLLEETAKAPDELSPGDRAQLGLKDPRRFWRFRGGKEK